MTYTSLPRNCPICGRTPIVAYDTTNGKISVVCLSDTHHNRQEPRSKEADAVNAWNRGVAQYDIENTYKNGWNAAREEVEGIVRRYYERAKAVAEDIGTGYDRWHFENVKRLAEDLGFDFEEQQGGTERKDRED